MPNYNDLQNIKDKIQDIGDEKKILDEKGIPMSDSPIPEESEIIPDKKEEEVVEKAEEENLLGDILEDFEKGNVIKEVEEESSLEKEATSSIEEGSPIQEDQFGFEDILKESGKEAVSSLEGDSHLGKKVKEKIEPDEFSDMPLGDGSESKEDAEYKDEGLEALLGKGFDEEKELEDFEIMQQKGDEAEGGLGAFDDVFEDLTSFPKEDSSSREEVLKEEKGSSDRDEELDSLLNMPYEEDSTSFLNEESSSKEEGTSFLKEDAFSKEDDDSFLKKDSSLKKGIQSSDEEILDKLGKEEGESKFDELPDLESLLGETPVENGLAQEGVKEDLNLEEGTKDEFEMPDFIAEEDKELNDIEGIFEDSSSREEVTSGKKREKTESEISEKFGLEGIEEEVFDLGEIDKIGAPEVDEFPSIESSDEEELIGTSEQELKDSSYGEIPLEISKDDIKVDQDIELKLSENERKQILITLTTLPKAAEIKISKTIISNKYSNQELKPLINALINKESSHVIIKYYERITKDKSLSQIEGIKYTGEKFEERKKSLGYLFEKNILPFIAKTSVIIAICVLFIFLMLTVISPTLTASSLYKEGFKLINNKEFEAGEEKFQEAYKVQPRFKEVVKYARKYRENKRYLVAEEKYGLARTMKPENDEIALEYPDFLREKRDFDSAVREYNKLIKADRRKLEATLGLAKTYFDWGEVEAGKYEDAKESYKDALEINKNNKEAIFGNLNINIKQKNQKEIINHYNYIERKFRLRVDPVSYTNLAEYFINNGELNEAKNVLDRASKSIKKNQYFPDLEYQYARYKKYLNVYDEEKNHLTKALSLLESMKEKEEVKYESDKFKRLLSNIYNDLGENAEISAQASPEAEKFYMKAKDADNSNGKPYFNLANFALKYKPEGYREAKQYYVEAEKNGFTDDKLDYNLGWLYFKERNYFNSYNRITKVFEKHPENSNLKFMLGTIFYKLGNYELSESILLENYIHFMDLSEMYFPLEPSEKEDRIIMEMLKKTSNNLGASYQKRFEESRSYKYLIKASKYYADSIIYFDKLENIYETEIDVFNPEKRIEESNSKDKKGNPNINFRMVLYPYDGIEEPFLYEDFPLEYNIFM